MHSINKCTRPGGRKSYIDQYIDDLDQLLARLPQPSASQYSELDTINWTEQLRTEENSLKC